MANLTSNWEALAATVCASEACPFQDHNGGYCYRGASAAKALISTGQVIPLDTLANNEELVRHLENFVPLGFVPGKDPYKNVTEAARAFLAELAEVLSKGYGRE